jgi:hypothetical protein
VRGLLWVIFFVVAAVVVAITLTHAAPQRHTGDLATSMAGRTFAKSVEARIADRRSKCMSAIGSPAFCDCLNGHLPLAADFQRYITVTTTSSANEQLGADDKRISDLILVSRDECVAKVFATTQSR